MFVGTILENCPIFVLYGMSNWRSSISQIVVDHAFIVAFGKCRNAHGNCHFTFQYFSRAGGSQKYMNTYGCLG